MTYLWESHWLMTGKMIDVASVAVYSAFRGQHLNFLSPPPTWEFLTLFLYFRFKNVWTYLRILIEHKFLNLEMLLLWMMIRFFNVFTFTLGKKIVLRVIQGFYNLIFRAVTCFRIFSFVIIQIQNVLTYLRILIGH